MLRRLPEGNLQLVLRLLFVFSPLVNALPRLSTTSFSHAGYRGNKVAPQNIAPGYSVDAIRHHYTLARRHREHGDDWANDTLGDKGEYASTPSQNPDMQGQSNTQSPIAENGSDAGGNATQFFKSQSSPDRPDSISPPSPSPSTGSSLGAGGCAHLGQLYADMNGPSWRRQQGWGTSSGSCCTWSGVTCKGASISALDLPGNGLSGPFSSSIFALSDLERL
jgi:hypothetical protein